MSFTLSVLPWIASCLLSARPAAHKIDRDTRIVNGIPTTWDQFPFIAGIKEYEWESDEQRVDFSHNRCGATLIRKEYPAAFLTAAHCVYEKDDQRTLQIGATGGEDEPVWKVTGWPILHYVVHEDYGDDDLLNDIAIIFAEADLTSNPDVYAATISSNVDCCNEGDTLRAIGYGQDANSGDWTDTIEYTDLEFISLDECDERLCEYDTGEKDCDWEATNKNQICALGDSTTPCNGDSGGPLIKPGTLELVGAVSWGMYCDDDTPTVFTNVASYYSWIQTLLATYIGQGTQWPPLYEWQDSVNPTDTPTPEAAPASVSVATRGPTANPSDIETTAAQTSSPTSSAFKTDDSKSDAAEIESGLFEEESKGLSALEIGLIVACGVLLLLFLVTLLQYCTASRKREYDLLKEPNDSKPAAAKQENTVEMTEDEDEDGHDEENQMALPGNMGNSNDNNN
mmetsp:Transcript_63485/g.101007  ORF Transcript_63485/g.101007 Transcript_63485/m.101007 type:complete len:454 (-) Transcript_63485:152-1513(-)